MGSTKVTVQRILRISLGLVIFAIVVLGAVDWKLISNLAKDTSEINDNWLPSVSMISDVSLNASSFRLAEISLIIADSADLQARYEGEAKRAAEDVERKLSLYRPLMALEAEREALKRFEALWGSYLESHGQMLALAKQGKWQQARVIWDQGRKLFDDMTNALAVLSEINRQQADRIADNATETAELGLTLMGGLSLFFVVAGIAVMIYSDRRISSAGSDLMRLVASVASAAGQASQAIEHVSGGAGNQKDAVRQIGAAIEQSSRAINHASSASLTAKEKAEASTRLAQAGQESMGQLSQAMEAIATNSRRIGQITETIAEIANKTNILSLNAAIEAARAAEHGRGFAVVAQAVGKLAEGAGQSAREITEIVDVARSDAEHGARAVTEAALGMGDIASAVKETDALIRTIATTMEEQAAIVTEVEAQVASLRGIADGNAASAEEITATMVQLARLAEETKKHVEFFRCD